MPKPVLFEMLVGVMRATPPRKITPKKLSSPVVPRLVASAIFTVTVPSETSEASNASNVVSTSSGKPSVQTIPTCVGNPPLKVAGKSNEWDGFSVRGWWFPVRG